MTIYDYIDNYGMYSFKEKKINEIDNAIFSFLSYANFNNIIEKGEEITIQEAARRHLGYYREKDNNVIAVREGNKFLRYIKDVKRYQNCILSNYEYLGNDDVQFGAITIEYEKNKVYVSFEGTDALFSGWKENFMLSFQFPTISHKIAISYLNRHFTFSNKSIIVGGHSKGGNLALVAGMYANFIVRNKIKKIYNNDGPGLLDEEFSSKKYQKIKKKYTHIIPNYSLVGLLLNHSNDKIINSSNKGLLAHDIVFWTCEGNHFEKTDLSTMSKELDKEIQKWFISYKNQDKIEFINNLDEILEKCNIKSIMDIKTENKKIIELIIQSKNMSTSTKKTLQNFIGIFLKCVKNTKKEEIKDFWTNIFKTKSERKNETK